MATRGGTGFNPIRDPIVCYLTSTLPCSTPDTGGGLVATVGGVEQTRLHRGDQSRNRSSTFLFLIGFDGWMILRVGMQLPNNLSKNDLAQRNKSSEHLPRHVRIIRGIIVNSQKLAYTTRERAALVPNYWILQGGVSSGRTVMRPGTLLASTVHLVASGSFSIHFGC